MRHILCLATGASALLAVPRPLHTRRRTTTTRATAITDEDPPPRSVAGTAALITGGAVGGGFLAVPRATRGLGLGPTAFALVSAWAWLGLCGVALAEGAVRSTEAAHDRDDYVDDEGLSVYGVALEATRHRRRKRVILPLSVMCFCLATFSSLGAQFAKSRELLGSVGALLNGVPAVTGIALTAYAAAFAFGDRIAHRIAYACTGTMAASFLFLVGRVAALPKVAATAPTSWRALLPSPGTPWAAAVVVQILCFGDVVGVAAARHEATPRRVPRALILGTVVPLAMALALALASSNLPGADPLSPLLKRGGMDAFTLRLFAASAVATTVIGLLLAASQLLSDVVCGFVGWCSERDRRIVRALATALPAVGSLGGDDAFYELLACAGAVPVPLLYCVLPPFLLSSLRRRKVGRTTLLPGGAVILNALKLAGVAFVGTNVLVR